VGSEAAETFLRVESETCLRKAVASPRPRWLDSDFELGGSPPTEDGLLRVQAAALVLVAVGALELAVAHGVVAGLAAALTVRGQHPVAGLLGRGPGPAPDPPRPVPPAPPGTYLAAPADLAIPAELDGQAGELRLYTLVLAPDTAVITTAHARAWERSGDGPQPAFPPFGGSGATDDAGRAYRLSYEALAGPWDEMGALHLSPAPPPGIRRLDLATDDSQAPVRLQVAWASCPVTDEAIAPLTAGEALLNDVTETMLGGGHLTGIVATQVASALPEVTAALSATGHLPPGSPSVARLAALCERRAIEVGGPLAAQAHEADVPESWRGRFAASGRFDGPVGYAPVAAVLPEIDGARLVLAGLSSSAHAATLRVRHWGWQPPDRSLLGDPGRIRRPLSWWARDDTGRWHTGRTRPTGPDEGPGGPGTGEFQVELMPPLDPAATSLTVYVTGASRRVGVTVPLDLRTPQRGASAQ
jgi:hypothetical protein